MYVCYIYIVNIGFVLHINFRSINLLLAYVFGYSFTSIL